MPFPDTIERSLKLRVLSGLSRLSMSSRPYLLMTVVLLAPLVAHGQSGKNESLTNEFPKLTAKERSRIAKKEDQEARADSAYQEVMARAEAAFQAGQFTEALDFFEQARSMRPYNVYPKVKIQDLQALLGIKPEQARPVARDTPAQATPRVPERPVQPAIARDTTATVPQKVPEKNTRPSDPPRQAPPLKVASHQETRERTVEPTPVPGERRYREGTALVIERTVEEEGRPAVYKRVSHPSGAVYYFENGLAIDERAWRQRFAER